MNTTLNTKSIVKNTLYSNNNNVRKNDRNTYLADMDIVGCYTPAPKLATLECDTFTPSFAYVSEQPKTQISFMKRIARFFGVN